MKNIIGLISSVVLLAILTGCGGSLVQNIDNSSYIYESNKITMDKMKESIIKGSIQRGWKPNIIDEGLIESSIVVRNKHTVVVMIPYTVSGYKIEYKNSRNMKYNKESNTIHGRYAGWIENLTHSIDTQISGITRINLAATKLVASDPDKYNSDKSNDIELLGKTIYIKDFIPYTLNSNINSKIKKECNINKQLSNFIKEYTNDRGKVKVEFKNLIEKTDIFLDVQISGAVSEGNGFIGHRKSTSIIGVIKVGDKEHQVFTGTRNSSGGSFSVYKGSCSVLGRTVEVLGKDIAIWLENPINRIKLGD
jgi:hypothetical protein